MIQTISCHVNIPHIIVKPWPADIMPCWHLGLMASGCQWHIWTPPSSWNKCNCYRSSRIWLAKLNVVLCLVLWGILLGLLLPYPMIIKNNSDLQDMHPHWAWVWFERANNLHPALTYNFNWKDLSQMASVLNRILSFIENAIRPDKFPRICLSCIIALFYSVNFAFYLVKW